MNNVGFHQTVGAETTVEEADTNSPQVLTQIHLANRAKATFPAPSESSEPVNYPILFETEREDLQVGIHCYPISDV